MSAFVDRERELERLDRFWQSGRAQCIPVTGRRRVGKTYLDHLRAMGDLVRPDVQHVLFSKTGFDPRARDWAADTRTRLLTPAALLAPF